MVVKLPKLPEVIEADEAPPIDEEIKALQDTTLATTEEILKAPSTDIGVPLTIPEEITFFGAEDAFQFGVDLPLDWQLKVTPEGTVSILDPNQWEFLAGDLFVSPEGTTLTLAQVEALMKVPEEQRALDFPTLPQVFAPVEPEIPIETRIGDIEAQLAGEVEDRVGLEQQLASLKTQEGLGVVFQDMDLFEIREYYFIDVPDIKTVPPAERVRVEAQQILAKERFDEFIAKIVEAGRTPETEAILKSFDPTLSDRDITGIFFPFAGAEDIKELPIEPMSEEWKSKGGSIFTWVEQQIGRSLTLGEVRGTHPIPELGYRKWSSDLANAIAEGGDFPQVSGDVKDFINVFSESLGQLPKQIASSVLQATQGKAGASVVNPDWADEFISEAGESFDEFLEDIGERFPDNQFIMELASVSRNLAFSVISLGTGLAVGIPTALVPLPGARVAAYALGTAASGYVVFQMTTYQIMQQYLELKNEEQIAETGKGLTQAEEKQLKSEFDALAVQYGLWEAVPEAISNLLFVSILTAPLTSMIGKNLATQIISKIVLMYGQELLTETITQKGQAGVELQAGLREGTISWIEAFKEIAPQTFLLTTIMAGAGQTVIISSKAVQKAKKSLKNEIGAEHPMFEELEQNIEEQLAEVVEAPTPTPAKIEPVAVTEEVAPVEVTPTEEVAPTPLPIETAEEIEAAVQTFLTRELAQPTVPTEIRAEVPEVEIKPINKKVADLIKGREGIRVTIKDDFPIQGLHKGDTAIAYPTGKEQLGVATYDILNPDGTLSVDMPEIVFTRISELVKPPAVEVTPPIAEAPEVTELQAVQQRAMEAEAEIEGLRETLKTDPVAQARFTLGGRSVGLNSFISIREQSFPEYFTVKQAQALFPGHNFSTYAQKGTKRYNRVPKDEALDELTKQFDMTPDEIADRVMQIREERTKIKGLESDIVEQFTKKPLTPRTELTTEQVRETTQITGQPKLTLKQVDALVGFFAEYISEPNTITAWELTRELRRETLAGRAENLKARAQELVVTEGLSTEAALKQAIQETLSGELPALRSEYLQGMTTELRDALFAKVYYTLKNQPFELASTVQALTNALTGKPIPREPGIKGGSAYTRLQRVFGDQPKVLKAIDTMAKERKPLDDVVEGIFHEVGRDPIPVDKLTADYLRSVGKEIKTPEDITAIKVYLESRPPTVSYDPPIKNALEQIPLWPTPTRDMVVKVLKELGWSPIDIGNFFRANKTSFDFSFWRQQGPLIFNHPVTFAQANIEAWESIWSQKSAEASWERITRDPLFQIYEVAEEAGYDFLRPLELKKGTSQWRGVEEFGYLTGERLIPRLTMKIPWVKVSARAFVTGTNGHNWRIYKAHYKAMLKLSEKYASGELTLKEGQAFNIEKEMVAMAKMLADFTQRGSLGKASALAVPINALFFAPRATLGRLLTPTHLISSNPRIRVEAWRNLTTFIGVIGGIVLLGWKMGLWEVERDPRNAEYMSIRIGNTRIDPWSGYRQFLVFFTRITTDLFTNRKGGMSSVTGAEYELNPIGALTNFLRGKASPLASIFLDFWIGKNFIGEEVDVANKRQWAERIAPFAIWDVYEAVTENNPEIGLGVTLPAILGLGVQTYTGEWAELFTKLGLPKYPENNVYGLNEPYYDTQDFWADVAGQFSGVDPATLTEAKGFPEYIRAIVKAREIKESLSILPNEKLINLNADPNEGVTFTQYYQMWLDREKLVREGDEEALKEFDQDERTRNAQRGNFSQRQFALLNEYWTITDKEEQVAFLEKHEAEIGVNSRQEWLKSHPKENAQLAVWGQAKILTKEAYNEFKSLVKSLDIPDNAIPELTLPPETSIETHFAYEDLVSDGKHASWEAQLLLKKDAETANEAGVESYADWRGLTLSDSPVKALELKVEHRERFDEYNGYADKDSPLYIEDKDLREEARDKFKLDNPEWVDDTRRIEAIENLASDETIEEWVDRGNTADEFGAGSSEAMLWLLDHPDTFKWALDQELLTDDGSDWNIGVLRINVQWAKYDDVYNDAEDVVIDGVTFTAKQIRDAILLVAPEYAAARQIRNALKLEVPEEFLENWVEYYSLPAGFARTDYLRKHSEYYKVVWLGIQKNKPI